ncbi:RecX family transcriptional regulator [Alginatibacterium sediminis]|uniref:RecX family transcriptional regulator n=1 Tax=Alginatibacterium sediminis TaxID=2164068 RepID=A0A420EBN7_9ALTE|nr:RecX family transcriptional regulator [Alginatibacterium sediminis]RKF18110.1 RecX family transcriptional regulator [Alginatibacterium sediminis]
MSFDEQVQIKKPFQALAIENVMNSAMYHLGRRDMTITELRVKLNNKTDNQDWIEQTIQRCLELAYLKSDADFSLNFAVMCFGNEFGSGYIRRKLSLKGIHSDVITDAIEQALLQQSIDESQLLLSRLLSISSLEHISKEKLISTLVNKGFKAQSVNRALVEHPDIASLRTKLEIKAVKANLGNEIQKLARKGKGSRLIQQQLKQKKICLDEYDETLATLELTGEVDFFQSASDVLSKKKFVLSEFSGKNKAYAYLSSRGYTTEQIKFAIEENQD